MNELELIDELDRELQGVFKVAVEARNRAHKPEWIHRIYRD